MIKGDPYQTAELDELRARQQRWMDALPVQWRAAAHDWLEAPSNAKSTERLQGEPSQVELALRRAAARELTTEDVSALNRWAGRAETAILASALTRRVGVPNSRVDIFEARRDAFRAEDSTANDQVREDLAVSDSRTRGTVFLMLAAQEAEPEAPADPGD